MTLSLSKEQIEALRFIDTPTLCNAIEILKQRDRTLGFCGSQIRCLTPEFGTMFGYAVTAQVDASTPTAKQDEGTWRQWVEAMDRSPKPCVLVFQDVGPTPEKSAHCGEIMATLASRLGVVGLVTDGGVRDIVEVKRLGFHYFSAGLVPAHGTTRFIQVNVPVWIDGVPIQPGDLIHGDANGVTTLPDDIATRAAEAADMVRQREAGLLEYIRSKDFIPGEFLQKMFIH